MFCGKCVHESRSENEFELCIDNDFSEGLNFMKSLKRYKQKWVERVDWNQECNKSVINLCKSTIVIHSYHVITSIGALHKTNI